MREDVDAEVPPCTASRWPSRADEPAPYAITGTRWSHAAMATNEGDVLRALADHRPPRAAVRRTATRRGRAARAPRATWMKLPLKARTQRVARMAAGMRRGRTVMEKSTALFIGGSGWAFRVYAHGRTPCAGRRRGVQSYTPGPYNRLNTDRDPHRRRRQSATGLGDGTRVPKSHARVGAMGDVDEAQLAPRRAAGRAAARRFPRELLVTIQHELFNLGGELSVPGYSLLKDDAVAAPCTPRCWRTTTQSAAAPGGVHPAGKVTRSASPAHVARAVVLARGTRGRHAGRQRTDQRRAAAVPQSPVRPAVRAGARASQSR